MKAIKKFIALSLGLALVASLTGCLHKKDEIAVTIGDVEFTSAYYMCALINAKAEAQQEVSNGDSLTDEETAGTVEIDYFSKKIDNKSFTEWTEDHAIEILTDIAAYKMLCKENGLELDEEQKKNIENTVAYYWDTYGYSSYFEPNGVSRDTYKRYTADSYLSQVYFDYLYGKEGTKALKTEDVNTEITDNYILVDQLSITYASGATDEDKANDKKTLENYANDIKSGKKSFIEIYKIHNEIEDKKDAEEGSEELVPINTYASVLGNTGTSFESDDFGTYKQYETDVPQVIENSDKTGVVLVIKRKLSDDAYFMDYLDNYARHSLADEDFEKEVSDYSDKLDTDINKYAVGQFKVKKIIEPETTN